MDEPTRTSLMRRFGYIFLGEGAYPPILNDAGMLHDGGAVTVDGPGGPLTFTPLAQDHGHGVVSLGFLFDGVGYSNDVVALPEQTLARLGGLDLWIVDALRYKPHPTHANIEQALAWRAAIAPKRTVLTNMHLDLDYARLRAELPAGVEPAYDGLAIDLAR
jgi:phosphoribosyl 1,2-cyclic phosphate phosphodiesterase